MRGKRITQNIFSNWMALAVSTAIGFFLVPYVVHHLGNVAYGVWVLAALVELAHWGLLDFGLRRRVMRYVRKETLKATIPRHKTPSKQRCGHQFAGALLFQTARLIQTRIHSAAETASCASVWLP